MECGCNFRTGLSLIILCQIVGSAVSAKYKNYDVGDCEFPKHGSLNEDALTKLQKMVGKSYTTTDDLPHQKDQASYSYSIGVCTVPPAYKSEQDMTSAGAIQVEIGSEKRPFILGSIKQTELMSGKEWLMLDYEGGQAYNSHCGSENRRTILMMICSPGDSQGHLRIIEENKNKTSNCFYMFELEHDNLCEGASGSGLSIGSIVVIVFLALVAVYLIGGFLYQRFVVGSKGLEQIPNFHFWKDFGNLQADGCDLICRCGGRQTAHAYRGIGDDQLTSTAEGEDDYISSHDDHLLPM